MMGIIAAKFAVIIEILASEARGGESGWDLGRGIQLSKVGRNSFEPEPTATAFSRDFSPSPSAYQVKRTEN